MAITARTLPALALLLTASTFIIGCGGPTRAGLEARAEARMRLAAVNAQVSYDQAKRAYEVGQFDRALREVRAAIDRYDQAAEYHLLHGRILLETHRLERSLEAFEKAAEVDETMAEPRYFAGIVFQRWSNNESAYEQYIAAAELDNANVQYLLAAAESLIALGQYDEANDLITPKLAYFEHNSALRHLMAQLKLLQGDPATAAQLFAEARMLNPDDELLLEELAWAQYAAGRYTHCYESIKQLHSLSGVRRSDLLHLEARCLVHMDRQTEARALYMELSRLNPADPEVWIELGALAWELGDMRRVATAANRAMSLAPERFEGYALRAIYAHEQGHHADAARYLRQAGQYTARSPIPHLLLGQLHEEQGDLEQALAAYAQALSIAPDNREARMLMNRLNETSITSVPLNE